MRSNIEKPLLSISVVSHGQGNLIEFLLVDLFNVLKDQQISYEIIITFNIAEDKSFLQKFETLMNLRTIQNQQAKGFGANHNAAFELSNGCYFAVVNPDIRVQSLNINELISPFVNDDIAVVAPLVLSGEGNVEDSARYFPTFIRFAKRTLLKQRLPDYRIENIPFAVDWVAGMFMVFNAVAYKKVRGFDERRFFMYLEDADICYRLHKNGSMIFLNPNVQVIHLAQRASRRSLKHMQWHIISAFRYLTGL
jgi:hypothetical protein